MNKESAYTLLNKTGLRKTSGRIAILNCLIKEQKPLTQQEIAEKLTDVNLNEVSIYRALEAFDKAGIIHRVEGLDKVWRFAVSSHPLSESCHPHFICTECGRVECLTDLEVPKLTPKNYSHRIKNREMILKGYCEKCT